MVFIPKKSKAKLFTICEGSEVLYSFLARGKEIKEGEGRCV